MVTNSSLLHLTSNDEASNSAGEDISIKGAISGEEAKDPNALLTLLCIITNIIYSQKIISFPLLTLKLPLASQFHTALRLFMDLVHNPSQTFPILVMWC